VFDKGKHVGWGGNCNNHRPELQGATCKRQFRYCKNSDSETRRIAKKWLLMGLDIPEGDQHGCTNHILRIPRKSILLVEESILDKEANEL
jgi:hypothetical protein